MGIRSGGVASVAVQFNALAIVIVYVIPLVIGACSSSEVAA